MPEVRQTRRLTKRRIVGIVVAIIGLWLAWQAYDIFTGKPEPKVDYATPLFEDGSWTGTTLRSRARIT